MTQCVVFGPPRVGKSCLYYLLMDKTPPGVPSTATKRGSGSDSTDASTEPQLIQITLNDQLDSGVSIMVKEKGGKWNEISSTEEETAMFIESVHSQNLAMESKTIEKPSTKQVVTKLPDTPTTQLRDITTTQLPDITTSQPIDTNSNNLKSKLSNPNTQLQSETPPTNDGVFSDICKYVAGGNVKLSNVQIILDKSVTVYYTDTGGQPEFHEVLPALTAGPSIFLLVFNLSKPLDSKYKVLYESKVNTYEMYDCFLHCPGSTTPMPF